jgi:EAL domain-containing protein (putative c-di-GMP-specific phosphodiesterase class I)
VLAAARELPADLGVHVNVHAATLCRDPELLNFLGDTATLHGISLPRITLGIIQHAPPWEGRAFQNALDGLRHIGVGVALDDVGLGESNYRMVVECRADYLKLDRHVVSGCHKDRARRAVLDSMVFLARRLGARLIAQGVESEGDLETVRAAGIRLAQGNLLAPPGPAHVVRDGLSRI